MTRFVEDLGPTAKRIAARKLQALQADITPLQTPSYQVPTAYATFKMPDFPPSNAAAAMASDQNLPDSLTSFGSVMNLTGFTKDAEGSEAANKQKNSSKTVGSVVQYKRNSRKASEAEKRAQSRGKTSEKQSEDSNSSAFKKMSSSSSKQPAGSSVIVDTRKPDDSKFRPIVLALEQSFHSPAEIKTRNRRSTNASASSTFPAKSQNKAIPAPSCKNNGKSEVDKVASSSKANLQQPPATSQSTETQPMSTSLPSISSFAFNMPFLKAQLNQMNPAAAQIWDGRLFEPTTRIAPRDYLRYGSASTSALNLASHQDEHQQIPAPRTFIYSNNSTNNAQPSWYSLAPPPLDSDLSLQL